MLELSEVQQRNLTGDVVSKENIRQVLCRSGALRDLRLARCRVFDLDLVEVDLSGAILQQSRLPDCVITNSILEDTDLSNSNLSGAHWLHNVRCAGLNLSHASMHNGSYRGVNFDGADMTGAVSHRTLYDGCKFGGASLVNTSFVHCSFKNCDFDGADLTTVDAQDVRIWGNGTKFTPAAMNWFCHVFVGQLVIESAPNETVLAWAFYIANRPDICEAWAQNNPMPKTVQDRIVPFLASKIGPKDRGPEWLLEYFRNYRPGV